MSDGLSGTETTPLKRDLRTLQQMLLDGQTSPAIELSSSLLMRSRSKDERDPFSEARIRMERALMGAVEPSIVVAELRWCVDRINALHQGSSREDSP